MKHVLLAVVTFVYLNGSAQQNNGKPDIAQKVNNAANKVTTVLAVFQPYLLKARQLFYDARQMAGDVKNASKSTFGKNSSGNNNSGTYSNNNGTYSNTQNNSGYDSTNNYSQNNSGGYNNTYSSNNSNNTTYSNNNSDNRSNSGYNNTAPQNNNNAYSNNNSTPQNYLPNQSLPVNNPSSVNNDGTGNWGNQNNGLYGNCLDVLTGTVMGLGEAEASSKSVDVIFVAANGSYQLWTPNYARSEVAAQYTSRSTTESAGKWSDINETEIAVTRITMSQFDQIQNNSQILNAVKNAQNYAPSITEFGKMDGKVYAVKAELENRTVYGLIAVVKQVGTDGSNGYLKIKIKAQGIDNNQNGQVNANAYLR